MGKTTLALAQAAYLSSQGKRVLLVEIADRSSVSTLLGIPPLAYEITSLESSLSAIKITGHEALKEYLMRQVRIEKIYRLFFENRPMRYFFDAAPAIRDLMILGKIVHELEHPKSGKLFDHIVVDTPATGHGLFLFKTPGIVEKITRFGPIFQRAFHIQSILESPDITSIHVVTLPRPIVITETLELSLSLKKLKLPLLNLFVNRLIFSQKKFSAHEIAAFSQKTQDPTLQLLSGRFLNELRELKRLEKLSKLPLHIFSEIVETPTLNQLADWFGKAFS